MYRADGLGFGMPAGPSFRPFKTDDVARYQPPYFSSNTYMVGACYDPKTNKALVTACVPATGVYVPGGEHPGVNIYRTKGDYTDLTQKDDGLEWITTAIPGKWHANQTGVYLQRIDDTLYLRFQGRSWGHYYDAPDLTAPQISGDWIYRDTSEDQDGTGPWVKHGTVHEYAYRGEDRVGYIRNHGGGGEIVVLPSGRWIANATYYFDYYNSPMREYLSAVDGGVSYSDDQGETWQIGLREGFGHLTAGDISGGMMHAVNTWSHNFGYFDGYWYTSGADDLGHEKHFKSSDGATWAQITVPTRADDGESWFDGARTYLFSTETRIYRGLITLAPWTNIESDATSMGFLIQYATKAPELCAPSDWTDLGFLPQEFYRNDDSPGMLMNAGPDGFPMWVISYEGWFNEDTGIVEPSVTSMSWQQIDGAFRIARRAFT